MTFTERNEILSNAVNEFQLLHDKYTCTARLLTDEEYETYIHSMDAIADRLRGTNMEQFVKDVCMAYLDDTEMVQKKLKEVKKE